MANWRLAPGGREVRGGTQVEARLCGQLVLMAFVAMSALRRWKLTVQSSACVLHLARDPGAASSEPCCSGLGSWEMML